MDALCVIAAPGTGTDHLCEVLRNFPDLASHPGAFETDRAGGIEPAVWPLLRRLTGIGFADDHDPRLVEFVHQHPSAWLDVLEIAAGDAGKRIMAFPLHCDQLPIELIEREIMPRTGTRVMLVVRRQIDSYVAWRKAAALAKMPEAGKMGLRLKLDPEEFIRWLEAQQRWYGHWRDYLKRRFLPCPVLRYESDIERQPAEAVLRRFAAAAAHLGVTLRPPSTATVDEHVQQRARNPSEEVRNWAEFSAEIFRRGLEKRAFGYPI